MNLEGVGLFFRHYFDFPQLFASWERTSQRM
jgi:hypothetical protein